MRYGTIFLGFLVAVSASSVAGQDDAFSLDGLVVTASPNPRSAEAVAQHVSVLDGDALRATGLTSLADALRDAAGLHVVRNGSFGAVTSVFLRGGESNYTLVLIDGVQVNQAGGGYDFASLTTDNVERVEVLRGPASALYGSDAVAGVIHVITRTGQGPPRARLRLETASYEEARGEALDGLRLSAQVAGGTDSFGYSASLGRDATDGILDFNNRHVNTVLTGNVRLRPDDRTRMALALRLADREYHFPTASSGALEDRNAFTFGDESLAHLSVTRRVAPRVEVGLLVGWSETDGGFDDAPDDPADTDGFHSLDHFRRAAGELRTTIDVEQALVTGGFELEEERQRSFTESLSSFGPSYGRSESARWNRAGFVHVARDAGPVAVGAGARVEDNELYGTAVTWQAGVSAVLPGPTATRARGSVGRAIKEPTFFEAFATGFAVGNPDLDPERSLSWELGLEQDLLGGRLELGATYFDQRFEDLIQFTFVPLNPGDPNYFNVAGAGARGIELDVEAELAGVDAGLSYTWLDTEVSDSGFDAGPDAAFVEGEALLRRPEHAVAARATRRLGARGRLFTRFGVVGSRADRSFDPVTFAPSRERLGSYALWAVGGSWEVVPSGRGRPTVTLSVRAENLLDEGYEETWGFRAAGRQLYVGMGVGLGGG